ncbi:related to alpha-amylase [Serendipita indica DSM 11827]|uniref:Related to alpha-amylase n=1 Tax=Serendipita indica (strain DSM 11827) TaxID=1109443 RepID=G4T5R4_SERID|nr:related to alpha-amylase [Serendipita indica DSM 11827]
MVQYFEWDSLGSENLSWWEIFEKALPDLHSVGCTQVWLPPPNKAMVPDGRGYDAYDLWDLGEFDQKKTIATRWGTKSQLLAAIAAAKDVGIEVIIDAVLNHKLGADAKETIQAVEVDPRNRKRSLSGVKTIEAWTRYNFTGRKGQYSPMTWKSDHFTGIDWDSRGKKSGVFRITGPGHHQGWSQRVDDELGNYDYLLGADIDHRHPDVQKDLEAWGSWVIQETGATGGFRLDAIKHMDFQFLVDFLRHTREAISSPSLFAVGEYWVSDARILRRRMSRFDGELAFFDVPLHHTFHTASKMGEEFDLRTIMKNSLMRLCPEDAVTFVDNHDTVIGQTLESWVDAKFKLSAYAIILLRPEGYPCVFHNDLYKPDTSEIATGLRRLMKARYKVAYGPTRDYFLQKNCIGWVRDGNDQSETGCVVALNNSSRATTLRMRGIKGNANVEYTNIIHPNHHVQTDNNGEGEFNCPPFSANVWIPSSVIELLHTDNNL